MNGSTAVRQSDDQLSWSTCYWAFEPELLHSAFVNAISASPEFPPTRWTAILKLRHGKSDATGEKALSELCEMYWYPLYAFARRCGQSPHDAEDLTQGFFSRLLERDLFAQADPARGRLRSFLIGAFKHFMSEEWRHGQRLKRGGGQTLVPLSTIRSDQAERELHVAQSAADPDHLYDQIWFNVLLEHALDDLEEEYRRRGKLEMFRRLKDFLAWNRKDGRLAEVASELRMSPGAVRVAVLRMRGRFRQLIEGQIAETVGNAEEAAAELEHLRRVLGA